MSELIVIGYDDPGKAEAARRELFSLSREYLVDVGDAVVATADADGKVRLDQMVNMWSVGASGGGFWGLLMGLLFLHPLIGVTVGAAAGALGGALSDYGINDRFMRDIASVLKPGQAALFVMARRATSDRVIERLGGGGGHILRTNLDTEHEAKVRAAFEAAHAEALRNEKVVA